MIGGFQGAADESQHGDRRAVDHLGRRRLRWQDILAGGQLLRQPAAQERDVLRRDCGRLHQRGGDPGREIRFERTAHAGLGVDVPRRGEAHGRSAAGDDELRPLTAVRQHGPAEARGARRAQPHHRSFDRPQAAAARPQHQGQHLGPSIAGQRLQLAAVIAARGRQAGEDAQIFLAQILGRSSGGRSPGIERCDGTEAVILAQAHRLLFEHQLRRAAGAFGERQHVDQPLAHRGRIGVGA